MLFGWTEIPKFEVVNMKFGSENHELQVKQQQYNTDTDPSQPPVQNTKRPIKILDPGLFHRDYNAHTVVLHLLILLAVLWPAARPPPSAHRSAISAASGRGDHGDYNGGETIKERSKRRMKDPLNEFCKNTRFSSWWMILYVPVY